jgi:hypothetical protein
MMIDSDWEFEFESLAKDFFAKQLLVTVDSARPGPSASTVISGARSDIGPDMERILGHLEGCPRRHGIYHPKSGIYHLRYIPWYMQNRKMVYIMVYNIDIYHGIYHYYHGVYHGIYHGIYDGISWYI